MIPASIRLHHAGIDRKALAFDEARVHACPHNGLEHMPKGITLAKAAMPIDRERRMVRHLVVEIEATEPAIGKVKLHFLAQPALRTDAVAVADNQHPDHELGVDRRPADLAVEGPQLLAKVSHYPRHHRIDAAKKMVPRNTTFEVEEIEQLALIDILSTHHDPPPLPRTSGRRNHDSSTTTSDFFNSIDPFRSVAEIGIPQCNKPLTDPPPTRYAVANSVA